MRERSRLKQRWVLADFLGELADLLQGGATLNEALQIAGRGESGMAVDRALEQMTEEVASGEELGVALGNHFPRLPRFCAEQLRAAQRAGDLPRVAAQMAQYMEEMEDLHLDGGTLRKIVPYLAAVLTVGAVVAAILLIFVIPQFEAMFGAFGSDLPQLTRSVIDFAHFLGDFWWILLIAVVLLVVAGRWGAAHSRVLRRAPGLLALRTPGLSQIYRLYAHAEMARTMGFVAALDGSPSQMLEASAEAVSSGHVREELGDARERVASGASLGDALGVSSLFSAKLVNIARIGESRGALERLLLPVAGRYAKKLRDSQGLVQMLEPLVITVLAVVIGTLVLAMYLPIFKIASVV